MTSKYLAIGMYKRQTVKYSDSTVTQHVIHIVFAFVMWAFSVNLASMRGIVEIAEYCGDGEGTVFFRCR